MTPAPPAQSPASRPLGKARAEGADRTVDVAIVGAGLAGLTAAFRLTQAGRSTCVLEARDRVGGRVLNVDIGDGKVVEVGGQWIGPTQRRIQALARELGIGTFPTYAEGEHLIEFNGQPRRYRGVIPPISATVLADVAQARFRLDRMARTVPLEAPWRTRNAEQWETQTFWTWIRRNTLTGGAQALLQLATEAVWAVHPGELSLLHALFYIHSAGGFDALVGTEGGAQQERFVGGSQLVAEALAGLLGDQVVLAAPVHAIHRPPAGGVRVLSEGPSVDAQAVIVTLPPTLTARLRYEPPLPGLRDQLTQRMPQGSVIKCMALYPQPFWREQGLTGQASSTHGPVKVVFDNSPPDGKPGVLLGFLEDPQARALGQKEQDERRDTVIACFVRLFGQNAARPQRYIEQAWAEEPYTRGCYGCFMPPGAWTSYGRALRAPIGPIHWAGAETATHWTGYMDGAVSSGEQAADHVLRYLDVGSEHAPLAPERGDDRQRSASTDCELSRGGGEVAIAERLERHDEGGGGVGAARDQIAPDCGKALAALDRRELDGLRGDGCELGPSRGVGGAESVSAAGHLGWSEEELGARSGRRRGVPAGGLVSEADQDRPAQAPSEVGVDSVHERAVAGEIDEYRGRRERVEVFIGVHRVVDAELADPVDTLWGGESEGGHATLVEQVRESVGGLARRAGQGHWPRVLRVEEQEVQKHRGPEQRAQDKGEIVGVAGREVLVVDGRERDPMRRRVSEPHPACDRSHLKPLSHRHQTEDLLALGHAVSPGCHDGRVSPRRDEPPPSRGGKEAPIIELLPQTRVGDVVRRQAEAVNAQQRFADSGRGDGLARRKLTDRNLVTTHAQLHSTNQCRTAARPQPIQSR